MDETVSRHHARIDELEEQRPGASSEERQVIDEELDRLREAITQLVGFVPLPPEWR